VVEASAPLGRYKIVFAPQLNVIDEALARHLAEYVKNGGTLVLGPRAGLKDEFNRLNVQRQPGPLAELLGGRVEQFYALDETLAVSGSAGSGTASIWGEDLSAKAEDTKVILRYGKDRSWLSEKPAALSRAVGKGKIVYLGTLLDPALMRTFVGDQIKNAGVTPWIGALPDGVEAMRRGGMGRDIIILVNHGMASVKVSLPRPMHDILHHKTATGDVTLDGQGVAVLEIKNEN